MKAAIQGSIYTSWYLHKTHLLELQVEEIRDEAKRIYRDEVARMSDFTSIDNNLEKMLKNYASVIAISESINSLSSIADKRLKKRILTRRCQT